MIVTNFLSLQWFGYNYRKKDLADLGIVVHMDFCGQFCQSPDFVSPYEMYNAHVS